MGMYLDKSKVNERDLLLFNEPFNADKYPGGIRYFKGLTSNGIANLLAFGVIDLEEQQNYSPTVEKILEFLKKHPGFTAHGYAVSPQRADYRVSIEGVELEGPYELGDLQDFFTLFRYADEVTVEDEYLYCWFD